MTIHAVTTAEDPQIEVIPSPPDDDDTEPPGWLSLLALSAASIVLGCGLVGLVLAINGWYHAWLAFPLGILAAAAVVVIAYPTVRTKRTSTSTTPRQAHVVAALGVAAILAITAWNGAHASQHVLINRDGGSYSNTGRWIARDGSLEAHPRVGAFAKEPSVAFDSYAVYAMPNGSLQFQFAHMLPVLLAESYAIAGDRGLFHVPQLLGGVALLAFFVLAWRLIRRPWFALAAMLALAFIIPQVSFSRDSYSEIPSQVLLFTALWLLVSKRVLPHWRVALASGLFLGATQATRVDASVFLIGVPAIFAVAWLRAAPDARRRETLPAIGAFALGLVPGFTIGLVDLINHSGRYWNDLYHDTRKLFLVAGASAVASFALVLVWRFCVPVLRKLPWRPLATSAAVVVGLAGFFAWIVRPHVQHAHSAPLGLVSGLQQAEHVAVDPTRFYYERSMQWMAWYLGPLTVAAAIFGAALLVRALILGRRFRVVGVLAVLVPGSLLYLIKANAAPDHVWVTRRFLVSAFPTLILLGLGLAAFLAQRRRNPSTPMVALRVIGVVIAVVAVGYPIYAVQPVQAMTEKRGYVSIVHDACDVMGPNAALVVLETPTAPLFDDWTPQAFRSWCGAETAITRGTARAVNLRRLAKAWNAQGRKLFVAAYAAETITSVLPDAVVHPTRTVTNNKFLELTLTRRPSHYKSESFSMVVAEVPPG